MADNFTPNGLTDHDLLIELRTEMRGVRTDVKDLRDNTSKRVDALENEKMNRDEVMRLKADADKIHDDHEERLRGLEKDNDNFKGKYAIVGGIIVIIVSALVSWAMKQIG